MIQRQSNSVYVHCIGNGRVSGELLYSLPGFHIPDGKRFIGATRIELMSLGIPVHFEHRIAMALQTAAILAVSVPEEIITTFSKKEEEKHPNFKKI
jgi:hypothetical protein